MWTCNRLDLQTLGSEPVMPKNLPDHWSDVRSLEIFHQEHKDLVAEFSNIDVKASQSKLFMYKASGNLTLNILSRIYTWAWSCTSSVQKSVED